MQQTRLHIIIQGKVQGVFFRNTAKKIAEEMGMTGWVRNLPDGRLEAVLEGEKEKLKKMAEWTKKGPVLARVEKIEMIWEDYKGEFKDFKIKR
ncbi:MAG: acylphosphatase [Candidatus Parcubacteria bacterium]|nr:acylphosphatase [Candidatus Parcubacteria bacterium]